MAGDRECECLESVVRVVASAVSNCRPSRSPRCENWSPTLLSLRERLSSVGPVINLQWIVDFLIYYEYAGDINYIVTVVKGH
jgi:hypothetical protein